MLPGIENKEQPRDGARYEREMVPIDGPDGVTRYVPVYRIVNADGTYELITSTDFHDAQHRGESMTYKD